jgi:hypothetical protein
MQTYLMNALSDAIVCRRSSAAVYSSRLQRIVVAYHYIVAGRRGGDPGRAVGIRVARAVGAVVGWYVVLLYQNLVSIRSETNLDLKPTSLHQPVAI